MISVNRTGLCGHELESSKQNCKNTTQLNKTSIKNTNRSDKAANKVNIFIVDSTHSITNKSDRHQIKSVCS